MIPESHGLPDPEPNPTSGETHLPVVIPAAPGSEHLATACAAAIKDGARRFYVVSEQAPEDCPGSPSHVAVAATAGFATRANAGLRAAARDGHRAALLLNDDTQLLTGSLRALADGLSDPQVAVAGAVLLPWESDGVQQSGIRVFERTGRIQVLEEEPSNTHTTRDAVSGAAMAVNLDTFAALGGFCEAYTFYFEDVDYCHRVRAQGHRVVVCRDARVRHREGGTQSRESRRVAWHLGRSQAIFARRLGGSFVTRQLRLATAMTLGFGWTGRRLGPRALPQFAAGVWTTRGGLGALGD